VVVGELETALAVNLRLVAQLWTIRDPQCGPVLDTQAEAIAAYWAGQAASSPRVARALTSLTTGGGIIGAFAAHAPIAVAIWQHHAAPAIFARRQAAAQQAADEAAARDAAMAAAEANGWDTTGWDARTA
jgi:hypothetical protein